MIKRKQVLEKMRDGNIRQMRKIKNVPTVYQFNRTSALLSDYFRLMWKAVLNGYSWKLPKEFGTIHIVKEDIDHPNRLPFHRKHILAGHEYDRNKRVMNPKTIGTVFHIVIDSEYMDEYKCRFKAAPTIRKKLFKELYYGNLSEKL